MSPLGGGRTRSPCYGPPVRVLGIESSTAAGSVALCEDGSTIFTREHREPHAHAERLLELVKEALAEASWSLSSLDRVAVDVGPGSFTGLRVGIALAQGICLGSGVALVGVGSLRAMAHGAHDVAGARCPVLDARRGELFVAVYAADGFEQVAPAVLAAADFRRWLASQEAPGPTPVGDPALRPDGVVSWCLVPSEPHARWIAELGATTHAGRAAVADYVRDPDVVRPVLPPSPFVLHPRH